MTRSLLRALVLASLAGGFLPATAAAGPFHADVQATTQAPAGWNEPSAIAGADGRLYIAAQSATISPGTPPPDVTIAYSTNGVNWSEDAPYYAYVSSKNDGTFGDVTMTADRAGTVFVGHINGNLEADIEYWYQSRM